MKTKLPWNLRYFVRLITVVTLCFAAWHLRLELMGTDALIKYFHQSIDQALEKKITRLESETLKYLKGISEKNIQKESHETEPSYYIFKNDTLIYYTSGIRLPAYEKLKKWKDESGPFVFQQDKALYAIIVKGNQNILVAGVLPLRIEYPVRNQFLKTYLFTGDDDTWPSEWLALQPRHMQLLTHPETGKLQYIRHAFTDYQSLYQPGRKRSFPWLIIGLSGLIYLFIRKLYAFKLSKWISVLLSIGLLVLIRVLCLWTGFPGSWVETEIFSPRILAINEWNPSLGDVFLNVLTLVLSLVLCVRAIKPSGFKLQAIPFSFLFYISGTLSGAFFFRLFEQMSANSQITLTPELFFSFSLPEMIFFASTGISLSLSWVLMFRLGNWSKRLENSFSKNIYILSAFIIFVLTGLIWISPGHPLLWITYSGFVLLSYFQGVQSPYRGILQLNFFELIFILLAGAWLSEVALSVGYREKQNKMLIRLTSRFSESHDPVAEYLYDVTIKRIQSDQELMRKQGRSRGLSEILLEDYIKPEFKSYTPRLFLFNQYGLRLDESLEARPLIHPFRQDIRYELTVDALPSYALYLVPFDEDELIEKVYVGRFEFFLPLYGKITGVLELIPRTLNQTQIYPRLLLDEDVPLRYLPEGFDFAVYRNQSLVRKAGAYPFPLQYTGTDTLNSWIPKSEQGYIKLVRTSAPDKTLILQTPSRSLIDRLVSTSVLFFYYIFLLLIFRIPRMIIKLQFLSLQIRNLLFVQKLRLLLLGFSLIPFLGIVFLFRPFIQLSFEADSRERILNELQQISNTLMPEIRVWLRDPGENTGDELQDLLVRASETYGTDMNLYSTEGILLATTQPRVFEMGLSSNRMPYPAYHNLSHKFSGSIIEEEKIGSLTFLSGYHQIPGTDLKPLAYLNIPYLSQQEVLDARIRNFMTTLVQLYLVVLLLLGGLSVAFSRLLTRPLILLRQRMDQTRLGIQNEPIIIHSGDEIGGIIKSYNRMLIQLQESEEKLARNQRESAWKEMARQVAHEIKNPLTPMKLSIQHLMRAWKENDSRLPEIFQKVTQAVLIQIDSLSAISLAFSSFASMPKPNIQRIDLCEVIQLTCSLYRHSENVKIILNLPESPVYAQADKDQLARVLQNLIQNALQSLTEDTGEIVVSLSLINNMAVLSVKDSGCGIPENIQEKIFQPNFSTKNSGMGLGLAMVKRIVESISGRIYFTTVEGEGSVFYIEIPLDVSADA